MIEVDYFKEMLNDAQLAYRTDVAYAVAVSSAARAIETKRSVWKVRLELREAAKQAKSQCENSEQFKCITTEPCGTGSCKFSKGDLSLLQISSASGTTERPQDNSCGAYSLEAAIEPLLNLRMDR